MTTITCISNSIREIWLFYYIIEYKSNLSEVKTPRHKIREEIPEYKSFTCFVAIHTVREIMKNRFLQFHPDLSPFP